MADTDREIAINHIPDDSTVRRMRLETRKRENEKTRKRESKKARKQESKKARKQESKKARKQESKESEQRLSTCCEWRMQVNAVMFVVWRVLLNSDNDHRCTLIYLLHIT